MFLAGALSYWRQGAINFDEALRLAIYYLLESNAALNRIAQDLAARAFPGPIVVDHPIRGSTDPREQITYGKIVPATAIVGGPEVADAIKPGQRVPFLDAQKQPIGYTDNFRVENGKTVCDVHLDDDLPG